MSKNDTVEEIAASEVVADEVIEFDTDEVEPDDVTVDELGAPTLAAGLEALLLLADEPMTVLSRRRYSPNCR